MKLLHREHVLGFPKRHGDCKQNVCDGNGATIVVDDDDDVPVDQNPCTTDVCTAGVPSNPPTAGGEACGTSGVCDPNGQCTGCNAPSDCPGQDGECGTRTCTNSVCGFSFVSNGTPVTAQITGDCKQDVCDGQGKIVSVALGADLPNEGNACTADVCNGSTPSSSPVTVGTACGQGNVCDAGGNCVGCVVKDTCPGQDDDCQTRTCIEGVCGVSFAANGTPVSNQQPGDCRLDVCDGAGKIIDTVDDGDVPDDQKPCTSDACTAGVPSSVPVTAGTTCGNAQVCDAIGQCVGCNAARARRGMRRGTFRDRPRTFRAFGGRFRA